jgi:hypothetical protein
MAEYWLEDLGDDRPPAPQRWLLVRGLALVLFAVATSASSLMLLGIGGIVLVPVVLLAGIIASVARSPSRWVFYGFLLSVGLYVGGFRMPFFSRASPSAAESLIWFGAGMLGFGMVLAGYLGPLLARKDQSAQPRSPSA